MHNSATEEAPRPAILFRKHGMQDIHNKHAVQVYFPKECIVLLYPPVQYSID